MFGDVGFNNVKINSLNWIIKYFAHSSCYLCPVIQMLSPPTGSINWSFTWLYLALSITFQPFTSWCYVFTYWVTWIFIFICNVHMWLPPTWGTKQEIPHRKIIHSHLFSLLLLLYFIYFIILIHILPFTLM